jgi:hypothetical protein
LRGEALALKRHWRASIFVSSMKLDLVILQIAILFLPGLIWARLDASWAQRARPSEWEFLIRAFMFGLASYAVIF